MINCPWDVLSPQNYHYCERQLCGWIQQPANTWSNIGYLIAAVLILRSTKHPKNERLFFFWASFILFLGSTFFHLSGTHIGKLVDVGAMLVLSMGICSLSLQRWFSWNQRKTLQFYSAGLVISLGFLFYFGFGNIPFSFEIATAAILEFVMIRQKRGVLIARTLLMSLFVEFLAAIFLALDITKTWCDPDNHFISGHGVWHLLSAAAIYLLFLSRKTE